LINSPPLCSCLRGKAGSFEEAAEELSFGRPFLYNVFSFLAVVLQTDTTVFPLDLLDLLALLALPRRGFQKSKGRHGAELRSDRVQRKSSRSSALMYLDMNTREVEEAMTAPEGLREGKFV
jgi:hypothetical protein